MSRSYSTFRERQSLADRWKEATYYAMDPSDNVQRPLTLETEGKQIPIIRYGSGPNGKMCVIKAEIAEHKGQPWEESMDFGVEDHSRRRHSAGSDDHLDSDKRFEEFINKVKNEASRGPTIPVSVPLTCSWQSKKVNDNPNSDKHNEQYLNNKDVNEFYERPRGNEGPNTKSHLLSKPTNDIGTAVDLLKELSLKPSYGNGKEKEKEFINSSPKKVTPLGPTSWHANKVEKPKDYNTESEEEEQKYRTPWKLDQFKIVNNRGGEKPFEKKDGYEIIPKRHGHVHAAAVKLNGQTPGKKKPLERIDSKEAFRRYGKMSSGEIAEEEYQGTISSREAAKRYNGVLVP